MILTAEQKRNTIKGYLIRIASAADEAFGLMTRDGNRTDTVKVLVELVDAIESYTRVINELLESEEKEL